jgi:hypothetical protein
MANFQEFRAINAAPWQRLRNYAALNPFLGAEKWDDYGTTTPDQCGTSCAPRNVRALSPYALADDDMDYGDVICLGLEEISRHLKWLDDDYQSGQFDRL